MRRLLTALALGLAASGALAQAWPSKPVTMIVPFPPGGSTDMIARSVLPTLGSKLGGTFIIDNKPGAGGAIGAVQAKNAKSSASPAYWVVHRTSDICAPSSTKEWTPIRAR